MKNGILTKLDGGRTGFRKVLQWAEQVRLKAMLDDGYKVESHGPDGLVLVKALANVPAIFGGTKR